MSRSRNATVSDQITCDHVGCSASVNVVSGNLSGWSEVSTETRSGNDLRKTPGVFAPPASKVVRHYCAGHSA